MANENIDKNIDENKTKLEVEQKNLRKLMKPSDRQKNFRERLKKKLLKRSKDNLDDADLAPREKPGQPKIIESQPLLLKAIVDIVSYGSSADDRRRSDKLITCQTLTQLTEELKSMGFNLSRSATYYHLFSRRADSIDGKRHIDTMPGKLIRAQNDLHHHHVDSKFATASIRNLETLASILGPKQVIFLSQDDKARVPLGITAAKKESPTLIHLEYRVRLPDHDWVIAERHKLIPSVIAGIVIKSDCMGQASAVSYSGPTYIGIRSGKHSSSTALTHAIDFQRILECFSELANVVDKSNKSGENKDAELFKQIKPIIMMTVDGGPDENPLYEKVINFEIKHFLDYNLDGIYIATNGPGQSAYNHGSSQQTIIWFNLAT